MKYNQWAGSCINIITKAKYRLEVEVNCKHFQLLTRGLIILINTSFYSNIRPKIYDNRNI